MNINVTGPFVYFNIPIFGGIPITQTTISLLVVLILLSTAAICLGRNLQKRPNKVQVLTEKGVMMLHNMVVDTMGAHNAHWTPFIGTLFLSSICGSYIGLTGFLRSTTADIAVPLVWAVMVSVVIWAQNIKHNGFVGWLKGFTEPIVVMTPMNLVSEIAQPIALAFRHFGNVAGGGVITTIVYVALTGLSSAVLTAIASSGLVVGIVMVALGAVLVLLSRRGSTLLKVFGIISGVLGLFGLLQAMGWLTEVPILTFGIPAVLSAYFDVFSGFIQALVFTLLSMVYIAGACPPPEEAAET